MTVEECNEITVHSNGGNMDIKPLVEKYKIENEKGLWEKIRNIIDSKDGRWDLGTNEDTQGLTQVLLYEYATSLEAITNGKLSAETVIEKLSATMGSFRFGQFKKGQDDHIQYAEVPVTSEEYTRLTRIDGHFGAHQVECNENGKMMYSVAMFDGNQQYRTRNGKLHKLSGGNLEDLDDIRQTLFHEWTHIMEKCLVKASSLKKEDIIKEHNGGIYINAYLGPDLTMEEYKAFIASVDSILESDSEVLFGGISTIEINEKKSPNRRIMRNIISEGATELISKKIMEHLGIKIKETDRYEEQADFVEKVFDSIGMDTAIATYLTSSNQIISYIESKNDPGQDILRLADTQTTALGNLEALIKPYIGSAGFDPDIEFPRLKDKLIGFWEQGRRPDKADIEKIFSFFESIADIPEDKREIFKGHIEFALDYPALCTEFDRILEEKFPKLERREVNMAITEENKIAIENATRSCIARLGTNTIPEKAVQGLLQKLYSMPDIKSAMDSLAMTVDKTFGSNHKDFDSCIQDVFEIAPEVYESKEALVAQLQRNKNLNYTPGNISIEENQALISSTLKDVCDKLNELGADYYIVGALSTFIKTETPLFRYHGDIDFMISEADLPKVAEALRDSNYRFSDDRLNNGKKYSPEVGHTQGEHEVIANHKDNEFHLGFFLFRREQDKSITVREYFMEDGPNGEKIPKVLERHIPAELAALEYSEELTSFAGTSFRTSTPESVFSKKMYTKHPKDLLDIEALEGKIDREKMEKMQSYRTTTKVVEPDIFTENSVGKRTFDISQELREEATDVVSKDIADLEPEKDTKIQ